MAPRKKTYLTKAQLAKRLAGAKTLILDVDGVLTDDSLYIGPDGFELKRFHIGDGLTIVLAMRAGLEVMVVSNRFSAATATRMKDLQIKHVIQERGDKARLVAQYCAANDMHVDLTEAIFIGNDIMDVPLMQQVGIKIAVHDSYPELAAIADYVTTRKGGYGAVREVLELYFRGKGLAPADFLWK
jgi:3-deoxy-D-manno-octulosonate 8-phosphate phosphatase (KDO 8-P phosphatase)